MKRGTREARFSLFRTFYAANKAGHMDDSSIHENLKFAGFSIYEKELEKLQATYSDIDINDFKEWLIKFGVLKGKKRGDGSRTRTSLANANKAKEVGVKDEDIETYMEIMQQMYELRKKLQSIVPNGVVTITIPNRQKNSA